MKTTAKSRSVRGVSPRRWPCCRLRAVLAGIALALLAGSRALPAATTPPPPPQAEDLLDLSFEQLMDLSVTVTSVSKREQKLTDAAAAISVLSNDDLRRSGATTLMEALRLVPGVNVGSVNSSQWSISARGFNGLYANKLLVMIDGRAVYNPVFSGVFWDLQQTMLADVDRVEVIRGPGATLWGANAVNGVINVVTRSAKDTQGTMVYGGGGDLHQALGGARFGGRIGEHSYYRVFGSYFAEDDHLLANGRPAGDSWQGGQGGFRIDHYPVAGSHLTWQADATVSDLDDHASDAHNFNTIGRWTRELSEKSGLEFQAYYDRTHRNELTRARATSDTLDLTAQHNYELSERNDMIWGLGYRFVSTKFGQTSPLIAVRNHLSEQQLLNFFIQDAFEVLPDKLTMTAGIKIEHNDFTGFEYQPSLRAILKPQENQTVWAAVSRAVRTPSQLEGRDVFAVTTAGPVVGPGPALFVPTLVGNPNVKAEELLAYELGYRIQPLPKLSLDLAGFYNEYRNLIDFGDVTSFVPGVPVGLAETPFGNFSSGETYGGEASATWSVRDDWRLTASYSFLVAQIHGSAVTDPQGTERESPRHQITLRSGFDPTDRVSLDAQLRYVDNLRTVRSYLTADLRVSYRPNDRFEIALVGQNLLDNRHPEQGAAFFATQAEVPRGIYGKVTLRF
jgi:iron complex outermembrane recepter protein